MPPFPPCLKCERASLSLGKRRLESSGTSSFPFLSLSPSIAWALSAPSRLPCLRCEARLLGFCFIWDLIQPRYMPNTLRGVLLFQIFYHVRAPMAPFFCPSGEQHPTTSHPCQRERTVGWPASYLKHHANAVGDLW